MSPRHPKAASEPEPLKPPALPTEREILELEKLRLEVCELSRPWWTRVAYLAPLATIVVALIGLIWATANGYFDLARRKNELDKQQLLADTRELEVRKRSQQQLVNGLEVKARQLGRENQALVHRTQQLESDKLAAVQAERELRARILALDQLRIFSVRVLTAPWMDSRETSVRLILEGFNIGAKRGSVEVHPFLRCALTRQLGGPSLIDLDKERASVLRWDNSSQLNNFITLEFPAGLIRTWLVSGGQKRRDSGDQKWRRLAR